MAKKERVVLVCKIQMLYQQEGYMRGNAKTRREGNWSVIALTYPISHVEVILTKFQGTPKIICSYFGEFGQNAMDFMAFFQWWGGNAETAIAVQRYSMVLWCTFEVLQSIFERADNMIVLFVAYYLCACTELRERMMPRLRGLPLPQPTQPYTAWRRDQATSGPVISLNSVCTTLLTWAGLVERSQSPLLSKGCMRNDNRFSPSNCEV